MDLLRSFSLVREGLEPMNKAHGDNAQRLSPSKPAKGRCIARQRRRFGERDYIIRTAD